MDPRLARQPEPTRSVRLPDGRVVVVRPAGAADVPALVDLFERLSPEDRYRRFFSGFHPDERFVDALVSRPPHEGTVLLAEVSGHGRCTVVAEAEFARSPSGDAELAMTVDRPWRGWLAPFLLDALLDTAAAERIPSLRAEVLVQNRPMLTLLRSRGCAIGESGDSSVALVVVGAHGTAPSWPPVSPHPRVALEATANRWQLTSRLREAGVPVLRCTGPASRPATAPCPVLEGEACPLVDGADLVIHALGRDDPRCRALLDAHRRAGAAVVELGTGNKGDEAEEIVAQLFATSGRSTDGD